ncbi:hypothetical protein [Streptomyces sp. MP131-18]|uniref:hypothetical protein n=1 Tax=Streptomyces sp. MP131-18 TaxID=1857892 RepID=UPI00117F7117|nr:hypothetical protein [Streptomyces sp. MP131-18]
MSIDEILASASGEQITEARDWASDCLGMVGDTASAERAVRYVEKHYPGGWTAFVAECCNFVIGERTNEIVHSAGRSHSRVINGVRYHFARSAGRLLVQRENSHTGEYVMVHEWTAPETRTYLAANGHRMTYAIIRHDVDGEPVLSQWDAEHAADCPCRDVEDGAPWGLPDW